VLPNDPNHEVFHLAEAYLLRGCLPSPVRMVYCNVFELTLDLADSPMAEVHHFQIGVTEGGISEDAFIGIIRDSAELFSWLPCSRIDASRLCSALPLYDDPYGFNDHRGVPLLCHFNNWYKYCDLEDVTIRVLINDLYIWMKKAKPVGRELAKFASRSNLVLHLLDSVPAGCEDDIFHYLLEGAKETLKEEVALCNPPLFSVLLFSHPRDCAMEDSLFEVNENSLDSIQWSIAAVLVAAYSIPDTFTVGVYYVKGNLCLY
jgi:hypothetical protein